MRKPYLALALTLVSWHQTHAQVPDESATQAKMNPSFEVVSVKPDPARTRVEAGAPRVAMHPSGHFTALNVTVRQLLLSAYTLRPFELVGAPEWTGAELFDILATAPNDFDMGQTKGMMRKMLEDRFRLRVRRTLQPMAVYSLEWANASRRPGRWLRRPSSPCDTPPADPPENLVGDLGGRLAGPARPSGTRAQNECPSFLGSPNPVSQSHDGWVYGRRMPLTSIGTSISNYAGRPIIDNTGLSGEWDWDIKFEIAGSDGSGVAAPRYGSLFTAIQEQLGLKLEARDSNLEVLVVDNIERPSPD